MRNASQKTSSLSKVTKTRLLSVALVAVSQCIFVPARGELVSVFDRERSTTEDVIYFRNGDELRGTVLNDVIVITTPYGDVKLNLRRCAGVSFEGARANTEAIVTVNQNRLTGIVKDRAITFKIGTSGAEIPVRKEKVRCIMLKRTPNELGFLKLKSKTDLYVMTNGDLLTGKVAKPSIKIQTDYGEIPVSFSEIKHIEMQGGNNVTAVIKKINGDTMRGTVLTEEFTFNLDTGATVEAVYKDKLAQVFVDDASSETAAHFGLMQPVRGESDGAQALDGKPWVNSLGMKFAPVKGTGVLFSIWETRVQDFEAFVQATRYDATAGMRSLREDGWKERGDTWKSPGFRQGPTHPVVGVSWEDAKAFCKWLTQKERAAGRLMVGQEYRLPTDAEWSVAVGLGPEPGSTPKEKSRQIKDVYPWGTQMPPPRGAGNYAGEESKQGAPANWTVIAGYNDGYSRTSPVGSFAANQFGLFDMGGNVWEWCEDLYEPGKEWRVLRGESWIRGVPDRLLSSSRNCGDPGYRDDNNGFRCVVVVGSSSLR